MDATCLRKGHRQCYRRRGTGALRGRISEKEAAAGVQPKLHFLKAEPLKYDDLVDFGHVIVG